MDHLDGLSNGLVFGRLMLMGIHPQQERIKPAESLEKRVLRLQIMVF